jgi:hypothetical protein
LIGRSVPDFALPPVEGRDFSLKQAGPVMLDVFREKIGPLIEKLRR